MADTAPPPAAPAAKPTAVPGAAQRPSTARVAEAPAATGKMQPPANVRPKGSPPATKDVANRMAPFFTEPGKDKDGPPIAPTAAQRQQERTRPPVAAREPAKETPKSEPKEIPKDLAAVAKDKKAAAEAPAKPGEPAQPEPTAEDTEKAAGYLTDAEVSQKKSGELGRHYKNLKKENLGLKAQLNKAREAAEKNPEVGKLTETLKERESRLEAAEQELRYTNFEASREFKEKYWTPYEKAFQEGRSLATELVVREKKDDLGEIIQEQRVGTQDDFDRIVGEGNTARAAQLAHDMFGEVQGAEIMRARREVLKLNAAKEEAKEKYKKEGGEIFKQRQDAAQAQQVALAKTFRDAIKQGTDKHPQWFSEVEGDPELNAKLAKGKAFAEACFSGKIKNADGTERQLTTQELAMHQAAMYNQASAFHRLVHEMKKGSDRIKELEAKLKEFEESQPGPGDAAREPAGGREPADNGPKSGRNSIANRMSRFVT
jgi:hypothetical protein